MSERLSHEREVEIRRWPKSWHAAEDLLAEIDALREDVRQLSAKNALLQEDLDLLARTRTELMAERAALVEVTIWREIDTCPVNTSVLIFIPNWDHYGAGIYRAIHVDTGTGLRWHTTGWSVGRDLPKDIQPTRWQFLPAVPEGETR